MVIGNVNLIELELTDYLILLVLLKFPILVFVYFKFIHKSNDTTKPRKLNIN